MTEEDRIQTSIIQYLRAVLPGAVVFAVPNGGKRSKREAGIMKQTGTLAGIPDVGIVGEAGRSWWLEVKTQTGRLSPEQKLTHNLFHGFGIPVAVVRSIDDVREALKGWGVKTVEVSA